VAVAATDVAFRDLGGDPPQRVPVLCQSHHFRPLVCALPVVEIEDTDVGLAAVDAWVRNEMTGHEIEGPTSSRTLGCDDASDMGFAISGVVRACVVAIAVPAHRLQSVAGSGPPIEFLAWE
jgi:hypothetical protein